MSLLNRYCVKFLAALSCSTVLVFSGCGIFEQQPENLDSLESQTAQTKHLEELQSWIFPPEEAESARRAFVERCVSKTGGYYREADTGFQLDTAIFSGINRDRLRESGYSFAAPNSSSTQQAEYDEAGRRAYFGEAANGTVSASFMEYNTGDIPADGCMAQSYQYIYGSVEDGMKAAILTPSFSRAIVDEVTADSTYQDLESDWSSCMGQKGYEGLDSTSRAWELAQRLDTDEESELAGADADCREEVQFEETVNQIQNDYYEAVYQRVKRFGSELEKIHQTASGRVASDRENPQDSSPIELFTAETDTASTSPEG